VTIHRLEETALLEVYQGQHKAYAAIKLVEIDHALKHLVTTVDGANKDTCIGFVGEGAQGRAITGK
jgi:hypothetical protein